jgi:hypothetical protein
MFTSVIGKADQRGEMLKNVTILNWRGAGTLDPPNMSEAAMFILCQVYCFGAFSRPGSYTEKTQRQAFFPVVRIGFAHTLTRRLWKNGLILLAKTPVQPMLIG